jgi:hypothetical protein
MYHVAQHLAKTYGSQQSPKAGELKTKQTNYCTNSVMSTYKEFKEVLSEK